MRRKRGSLFVVSAPSGAGKTSLCQRLCETVPGIRYSVSYTTREPRPGEVSGLHYHFVPVETFRAMIDRGEFVEWAEVFGNYYGTSRKRIEEMMEGGIDVILDIDVQGAKQIRKLLPGSLLIFILPPSLSVLRARLTGRKSDAEDVIGKRLAKAQDEMREYKCYDYVIVNDMFDVALRELSSVVIAERVRVTKANLEEIDKIFLQEGE
ncbi:MAG: guanylate kinase [Alphaproteobacteria bacterium]|uniref:Guanylate kinase n=1 Tax=Candidatus Nitrobium versatile TaxID=2884831 RepID=A0A953LW20_9BACT|nr:guanylate kinase [Candidatus Nitrobium versatile]